jgi:hypothetical protein
MENALKEKATAPQAVYCADELPRRKAAIKGPVILYSPRDQFWGGKQSRSRTSEVLTNPTGNQLFAEFKKHLAATRNRSHYFFEYVYPTGESIKGVPVYRFFAGS